MSTPSQKISALHSFYIIWYNMKGVMKPSIALTYDINYVYLKQMGCTEPLFCCTFVVSKHKRNAFCVFELSSCFPITFHGKRAQLKIGPFA